MEYKEGDLFMVSYYDAFSRMIYSFEPDELIIFTGRTESIGMDMMYEMKNSVGNIEWMMKEDFTPCEDTIVNTYETIKKKIKTYKEEEEYKMSYKEGDLFKVILEIPNNKALKLGQIVNLIRVGSDTYTIKDDKGSWHYVPFKYLEFYDELVSAPLSKKFEEDFESIIDAQRQQYIDKCLDEGNFEGLAKI